MSGSLDVEGVDADRLPGVAIDHIVASRRQWQRENRRPRSLSAREALKVLQFECLLVLVAAENLAQGMALSTEDRERLALTVQRVDLIADEATG